MSCCSVAPVAVRRARRSFGCMIAMCSGAFFFFPCRATAQGARSYAGALRAGAEWTGMRVVGDERPHQGLVTGRITIKRYGVHDVAFHATGAASSLVISLPTDSGPVTIRDRKSTR